MAAGVVMVGFIAAISLLLRHWGAIERYHQPVPQEDLTTPLLQVRPVNLCAFTPAVSGAAAAAATVVVVSLMLQRAIGMSTQAEAASASRFKFPDCKVAFLLMHTVCPDNKL